MSAEQLSPGFAPEFALPPNPVQRLEQFIAGGPKTRGIYVGMLAGAEDGVYVSPDVATKLGQENLPEIIEVEPLPGAQLGAGDSHHEVMIGSAQVKIGDETSFLKVAIKPFTTDSEAAGKEHGALIAAKRLGFDTFSALAVAKDGDTTYLITEWRDDVASLDSEEWHVSPSDSRRYTEEVLPNLYFIAINLAKMNAKGLFHGDAQIKNFAKNKEGECVVIDLEDAVLATDSDMCAALLEAGDDLYHFWYSAIHPMSNDPETAIMFMEDESYETCMFEFENNFVMPYLNSLVANMEPELAAKVDISILRATAIERIARTT